MFDIMYESKGIGLSAPQVNISKRIIVWNALYEKRKEENERIFINPSIVEQSLVKLKLIEGCLSFPGIEGKVERPSIVSISYYDINGYKHLKILKGIHSRIFQHEFDRSNEKVLSSILDNLSISTLSHSCFHKHKKLYKLLSIDSYGHKSIE